MNDPVIEEINSLMIINTKLSLVLVANGVWEGRTVWSYSCNQVTACVIEPMQASAEGEK